MKETRRALACSVVLLMTCGPFASSAAADIAETAEEAWKLYDNIAQARTTVWIWENTYADRQIDLADPTLLYLEMLGGAYGEDRKAGLRTVITEDKEEFLRSVKLMFAALSRAVLRKNWGDLGQRPPGAEEFSPEKIIAQRDELLQHYLDADARIREAEENNLKALKVSIAELKLEIGEMEKKLAALFEGPEEAPTDVGPGAGAPKPGPQKRFEYPRWNGAYVDNCLRFASQCGKPAAQKFCALLNLGGVADWNVNLKDSKSQHQRTVVLGEDETVNGKRNPKRICSPMGATGTAASPSGKCVGFEFIECK